MNNEEDKKIIVEQPDEPAPDVDGPITYPKLGVIVIAVLLGLIIILAIVSALL